MSWPEVALGEVLAPVATIDPVRRFGDSEFQYVDLSAVDRDQKRVIGAASTIGSEAPTRARQVLAAGDVVVSTVRPNLNAVARIPASLDGAIGSTGFAVLRTSDRLDPAFLLHWVRSPIFVDEMVRRATGASYPAVSDRIVRESSVPLPPLEDQRRIARVLDSAKAVRTRRQRALAINADLVGAVFHETFVAGRTTWPTVTVSDLVDPARGGIRTGPFGSQLLHSEFVDAGVAVLGIDNAVANDFRWAQPRHITEQKYAALKRYTVHPGDVLITIMGTCGRAAVVPGDVPLAINTKHLCCITVDRSRCLPEFLHAYFLRHPRARHYLTSRSKGAIMSGLNMGIIKSLPVELPPLGLQRHFVGRVAAISSVRRRSELHLAHLDALFASLQHRAFAGEL